MKTRTKKRAKAKTKVRHQKNPYIGVAYSNFKRRDLKYLWQAEQLLGSLEVKPLYKGGLSEETYLFNVSAPTKLSILDAALPKGQYILKFHKSPELVDYLKRLSAKNLIPKIYYIDNKIIIQEFINGVDGEYLIYGRDIQSDDDYSPKIPPENFALRRWLFEQIKNELNKWHAQGFLHGDLNLKNILISKNGKVYLIDPFYIVVSGRKKIEDDIRDLNNLRYELTRK